VKKLIDHHAYRRVALAVIWRAADDMRRKGTHIPREWLDATVFLASKAALRWLDAAQLEPVPTLLALRWAFYAEKLLTDPSIRMSEEERALLVGGVILLNG
jgi:hypothetical protein|tara:strand:+ start:244 stop:546 length:303 start_codon:yes stop_codon:yes gene_type:complete